MTDRFSEIKNILFDQNIAFELKTYLVLQHQLAHIPLFKKFATNLNYSIHSETSLIHYPYLPIDFFRNHEIIIDQMSPVITFESSGTTDSNNSKHLIADIEIYKQSILNGFVKNYGHPSEYVFWSLLPSYLERQNASLIYMVKYLMDLSNHPKNGFFRFNYEELIQTIQSYVGSRKKFIIGVSFALLDMAEKFAPIDLK